MIIFTKLRCLLGRHQWTKSSLWAGPEGLFCSAFVFTVRECACGVKHPEDQDKICHANKELTKSKANNKVYR